MHINNDKTLKLYSFLLHKEIYFLLSSFILLFLASAFALFPSLFILGVISAAVYLVIFLISPEIGLMIILLLRSSMDLFAHVSLGYKSDVDLLSPAGIFTLLFMIAAFLFLTAKKINVLKTPIARLYLLFFLWCLLSSILSSEKLTGLPELIRLLGPFFMYLMVLNIGKNKYKIKNIMKFILLSFILPVGVGFYQAITNSGLKSVDSGGVNRIMGTFVHPNMYAFYLLIIIALSFVFFAEFSSFRKRMIYGLIFITSVVSMFLTYTRAGWIAMFLIIISAALLRYRKIGLVFLVSLIIVILIFSQISIVFMNRLSTISIQDIKYNSLLSRFELWKSLIFLFKKNPISGIGLGGLREQLSVIQTFRAHNDYLRILVEVGFVGLSLYIAILINLFKKGWHLYKKSVDKYYSTIALGFTCLCVGYAALSLTDNLLTSLVGQLYFWTLAGIIGCIDSIEKKFLNSLHNN